MCRSVIRSLLVVNALVVASLAGGCATTNPWDTVTTFASETDAAPASRPVIETAASRIPAWGEPFIAVEADFVVDEAGPYTLDAGDRLRIFVYGQPNLSRIYIVDQQGRIAVPLIGEVDARGRTTRQLTGIIARKLGSQFVKDPQVTVDIAQNRPFFILGEVRNAGQYPFVSGLTVQSAVAIAGGYADRASERSVRITRRRNGLVEKMDVPPDYLVRAGDEIYVYERWF